MNVNREDIVKLNALRVEALYSNTGIPVAVTLVGCVVLFFVLLNKTNMVPAISWLSILLIVSAFRYFFIKRFKASTRKPEDYKHWLMIFLIGTICSGLVLGSTAYVFIVDDDVINVGLLTMFILVLNSGSIGIYSAFKRVYYGFNIPVIVPLIFYFISQDNAQLNKLGMMFVAFVIFIFIIQYHSHKILNQMISVKLDNINLMDGYELDQSRISILDKMYNTNLKELEKTKLELASCQEKLNSKNQSQ